MAKTIARGLMAAALCLIPGKAAADFIIDPGSTVTVHGGSVIDSTGSVVIGGVLDMTDAVPGKVQLTGNWNNSGSFVHGNSTVQFYDLGVSSITGNTTFYSLISQVPNRALQFQNGSTQTVRGTFSVAGNSAARLRLRSTVAGQRWGLHLPNGAHAVATVDVQDSNALTNTVTVNSGLNSGNNNGNWIFPGLTYTATSYQTGNWSDPATWVNGVRPSSYSLVYIQPSHTVTLDQSATVGNDISSTAVRIAGALTWGYPSGNFTLTARGGVEVVNGGQLLMGTVLAPIPADRTATLVLNSSTTGNPYGLVIQNGGALIAQGAARDIHTRLLSHASSGDSAISVISEDEIEGWNVGDEITIAKFRESADQETEKRAIAAINGSQITLSGALDYPHASSAPVANLTRNVLIRGRDAAATAFIHNLNSVNAQNFDLDWAEAAYLGLNTANKYGITFTGAREGGSINACSVHEGYVGVYLSNSSTNTFTNSLFYGHSNHGFYASGSSHFTVLTSNHFYGNADRGAYMNVPDNHTVIGNLSYSNAFGMYFNSSDSNTIARNTVFSNTSDGIYTQGSASVTANRSFYNSGRGFLNQGTYSFFVGNVAHENAGAGFFETNDYNTYRSNVSYGNGDDGFYVNFGQLDTFIDNESYLNTGQGFSAVTSGNDHWFIGNRAYGNTSDGIAVTGNRHYLARNFSYSNQADGYQTSGDGIDIRLHEMSLGYDAAGNSMPNGGFEIGTDSSYDDRVYAFNSKINQSDVERAGLQLANDHVVSFRHNQAAGQMAIWGDYRVSNSTVDLRHAYNLYPSSASAPRIMQGSGHAALINFTNDANAVTQLISIEYRGGQWHIDGSVSGRDMIPAFGGALDDQNVPAGAPQFNLDFTPGGSPAENHRVDFILMAGSNDAGSQKKLLFGNGATSYNGGRARLTLTQTSTFTAIGTAEAPTVIDWLDSSATYYSFISSGASFRLENFAMAHASTEGLKFILNPSTVVIRSGSFDYGMLLGSTRALITLSSVTSTADLLGVSFKDSEPVRKSTPSGVRVLGNDVGLSWNFYEWGGERAGTDNEYDLNGRIQWIGDLGAPSAPTGLTAMAAAADRADLAWISPGDDGADGILHNGSEFRVQYSSWTNFDSIAWSTPSAQVSISTHGVSPGTTQGVRISGLLADRAYYFRMWAKDPEGNWSGMSAGATVYAIDSQAPGAITDLAVSSAGPSGTALLSWTFPGDNGYSDALSSASYRIQYSTSPDGVTPGAWSSGLAQVIASTGPISAGATAAHLIGGLNTNKTYYFRAWVQDESGWIGALSNAATGYVPGSAQILSAQGGNWSDPNTWTGGNVPGNGDRAVIQAGHAVIIDQDVLIGNDASSGALKIYGSLSWAAPPLSYTLYSRGFIELLAGATLAMGSAASPIPAASSITLVLATIDNANPYGLTVYNGAKFVAQGASKDLATTLGMAAGAGSTVLTVASADQIEGWRAGDEISIAKRRLANAQETEQRTITEISGNRITISAALDYAHAHGAPVANLTRNVLIRGISTALPGYVYNLNRGAQDHFDVDSAQFLYLGRNTANKYGVVFGGAGPLGGLVENSAFRHGYAGLYIGGSSSNTIRNNVFYGMTGTLAQLYLSLTASNTVTGNHFVAGGERGLNINASSHNLVADNLSYSNENDGIAIEANSNYNRVLRNRVFDNLNGGIGISLDNSKLNLVEGNESFNNYAYGIYLNTGYSNVFHGNRSNGNSNSGFYLTAGVNLVVSSNTSYANSGEGFFIDASSSLVAHNVSYGNTSAGGYGIFVQNDRNVLLDNRTFSNGAYGLYLNNAIDTLVADSAFGYDLSGNSDPDSGFEVRLNVNSGAREQVVLKNTLINASGSGETDTGEIEGDSYILSYRHQQAAGQARLWGKYRTWGSTLSLQYASDLYTSTHTAPKTLRGPAQPLTVHWTSDASAIAQLVTLEYRGGQWHVDGSESGADMIPAFSGSLNAQDVPESNPQFNITFSPAAASEYDRIAFALIPGSRDANAQKKLEFGKTDPNNNGTRSMLIIDSSGTFKAIGARGYPTIIDQAVSNGTYYTFIASGGYVHMEEFQLLHVDTDGLKFVHNPSTVILRNGLFDYGMLAGSTRTLIQLSSVTCAAAFENIAFGDSEPVRKSTPSSVRVMGDDAGLNWTFLNWSGTRGGPSSDYDLNDRVSWSLADSSAPQRVTGLAALPAADSARIELQWAAPGDDGTTGSLHYPSQFAVQYSTFDAAWSTSSANDAWPTGHVYVSTSAEPLALQGRILTGLDMGATYYFRIWSMDEAGNWSDISNGATSYTLSDTIPPHAISDLTALMDTAEGRASLSWTAPGDDLGSGAIIDGALHVRYATSTILSFDSPPPFMTSIQISSSMNPGARQGLLVTGLNPGTTYFFAAKTRDDSGNWSAWSWGAANKLSSAPVRDLVPNKPTGVSWSGVGSSSLTIQWVNAAAPAYVNDLDRYWVYRATYAFSSKADAYVTHVATLAYPASSYINADLLPETSYFFRLIALDKGDQGDGLFSAAYESGFTAAASTRTGPDIFPPSAISDLTALTGGDAGEIALQWSAPGDDGTRGTFEGRYQIKYSSVGIIRAADFDTPPAAMAVQSLSVSTSGVALGSRVGLTFSGLQGATTYWFAIKSTDTALNVSVWNSSADVATVNLALSTSTFGDPSNWKFWLGDGAANNWNAAGNWQPSGVPGNRHIAVFNGARSSQRNANIDASIDVSGIVLQSDYAGTVTQQAGFSVTIGTNGYVQYGGRFTGGNSDIDIIAGGVGSFQMSGGTFTATASTMAVGQHFAVAGGSFAAGGGTLRLFDDTGSSGTLSGAVLLNNLTVQSGCNGHGLWYFSAPSTFTVNGNLIAQGDTFCGSSGRIYGAGRIEARGNLYLVAGGVSGHAPIALTGDGDQTVFGGSLSVPGVLGAMIIDKPAGTAAFRNVVSFIASNIDQSVMGYLSTASLTHVRGAMDFTTHASTVILSGSELGTAAPYGIELNGNFTFASLQVASYVNQGIRVIFRPATTARVTRTLTLGGGDTLGVLSTTNSIRAEGDVFYAGNGFAGGFPLTLAGAQNQSFSQYSSNYSSGTIVIDKTSGTVMLLSTMTLSNAGQHLIIATGTLDMSTFGVVVGGNLYVSGQLTQRRGNVTLSAGGATVFSSGAWIHQSTGSISLTGGQTISNDGAIVWDANGGSCGGAAKIHIARGGGGASFNLAGSGSWTLTDVHFSNASASPQLIAYNGTDGGGNSGIVFDPYCPNSPPDGVNFYAVTADSASASWSLIPGRQYQMAVSSDSTFDSYFSSAAGNVGQSTVSYSGLIPNTTYFFKVKTATHTDAGYNTLASTLTFARSPAPVAFAMYHTSASVLVNPSDNQAGTTIVVTTGGFAAGASSAAVYMGGGALGFVFSGLTPNSTHSLLVQAVDFLNRASSATVIASTATAAREPSGSAFTGVHISSIVFAWSNNGNSLLPPTRYQAQISSSPDFAGSLQTSSATFLTSVTTASLTPNTSYYFRARTLAVDGSTTAFDAVIATYTQAGIPQQHAQPFELVLQSSITVRWAQPDNPPGTLYLVDVGTSSDFGGMVTSSATFALSAGTASLTPETTYHFRVKARNHAGVDSAFLYIGSTATLDAVSPDAISDLAAQPGLTDGEIRLSWTAPGNNGSSGNIPSGFFHLQYSTDAIPNFDQPPAVTYSVMIATSLAAGSSHGRTVTGLNPGATYYFAIKTRDHANWSSWSTAGANPANFAPAADFALAAPAAPALSAVHETSVTISWSPPASPAWVDDRALYRVYRATFNFTSAPQTAVSISSELNHPIASYQETGLVPGVTYYFRVTAVDAADAGSGLFSGALEGAFSAAASTSTRFESPTAFGGNPISDVSIVWNWLDRSAAESGYQVFSSTDGLFATLAPGATTWQETGLSPNAQYGRYVRAYSAGTLSSASLSDSLFTLASVPGTPELRQNGSAVSLDFTLNTGGNPAGTQFAVSVTTTLAGGATYYVRYTGGGLVGSEFWQTEPLWTSNVPTITGLAVSTTYHLRIKARNGDLVQTGFSAPSSTLTFVAELIPPANVSDLAAQPGPSDGDVRLQWTAPGDDLSAGALNTAVYRVKWSTSSFAFFSSTESFNVTIGTNGVSGGAAVGTLVQGLYPGTTYFFAVIARDDSGNWSGWNQVASFNTGNSAWAADLPLQPPLLAVSSRSETTINLAWTLPPAPAGIDDRARYRLYRATFAFSDLSDSAVILSTTVDHPIASYVESGLASLNTYYFRMTAVDQGDAGGGLFSETLVSTFSVQVSTQLSLGAPSLLYASAVSSTTVIWSWQDNSAIEQSFVVLGATLGAVSPPLAADTTYWLETDLSPNRSYTRYARAVSAGAETSDSTAAVKLTLAAAPGRLAYANLTNTSLNAQWSAQGNSTFTAYTVQLAQSEAFAPILLSISFSGNNKFTFTELTPNTTYAVRVKATNQDGIDTDWTSLGSTRTLASTLPQPVVLDITSATWRMRISEGDNPADTELALSISQNSFASEQFVGADGVPYSTETWRTRADWDSGGTVTIRGLTPNVRYQLRLRARNGSGVAAGYSAPLSSATLAADPLAPSLSQEFDLTFGNHAHVAIAADGNSADTEYSIFQTQSGSWLKGDGTLNSSAAWKTAAQWAASHAANAHSGLLKNTSYSYQLQARNLDGALSNFSSTSTIFVTGSDAGLSIAARSPSAGGAMFDPSDAVRVNFAQPILATSVSGRMSVMAIRNNLAGSIAVAIAGAVSVSSNIVAFQPSTALARGYTYSVTLSSGVQDLSGNTLAQASTWSFTTAFDPSVPNAVNLDSKGCNVTFAAGAFPGAYSASVVDPLVAPEDVAPGVVQAAIAGMQSRKSGYLVNGGIVEINIRSAAGERLSVPRAATTLRMSYPDANNDGFVDNTRPPLREDSVSFYWLNERTRNFVRLPASEIDAANNVATVELPHFSVFAIMGAPSTSLNNAHAYPVPFVPARGHTAITFTDLPTPSTIRIFTPNGEEVAALEESDGDGEYAWNARDKDGNAAASGVYLYLIKSPTDTKKGKLIIAR